MLSGREAGILPVGLGARDTLRLEASMPLYGHELEENVDPYQAGLGFAVNLGDRRFVGRDSLEAIKAASARSVRVGIKLDGMRAARQGASILDSDSRVIGVVTSGSHSPTLNQPIAMGYIEASIAIQDLSVEVDIRGSRVSAKICPLPFYRRKSS